MAGPLSARQETEAAAPAPKSEGKSARLHHLSDGPAKGEVDAPPSPSTPAVSFLEPLPTPSSTCLRAAAGFEDEVGTPSWVDEENEDLRDGTTVLPLEDNEDRRPFRRPGTPPFSPSQSSFRTDRLSVQSTTVTDLSSCSPSPSPSIGSVRMAQITKIPHRPLAPRMSLSEASVLSESVEDAPEDTEEEVVWDTQALSRRSHMDRLPEDLAAILRAKDDKPEPLTSAAVPDATAEETSAISSNHSHETVDAKIPPSTSQASLASVESWKAGLEDVADNFAADPADRMKSILGESNLARLSALADKIRAQASRSRSSRRRRGSVAMRHDLFKYRRPLDRSCSNANRSTCSRLCARGRQALPRMRLPFRACRHMAEA